MKLIDIGILVGCCVGAYIIGSIPVGYLVARLAGVDDIREHGSGNIGATNVARTLGGRYFIPVFLLDFVKAYATTAFAAYFFPSPIYFYVMSVAYLVGNGYSLFLRGSGGKGVAATAGILTAYNPTLCVLVFATWALFFAKVRTVGIASVCSAAVAPVCALLMGLPWHGILFVATVSGWIIFRHMENIRNYFAVKNLE